MLTQQFNQRSSLRFCFMAIFNVFVVPSTYAYVYVYVTVQYRETKKYVL